MDQEYPPLKPLYIEKMRQRPPHDTNQPQNSGYINYSCNISLQCICRSLYGAEHVKTTHVVRWYISLQSKVVHFSQTTSSL